ncbi:hypothetical protein PILCRDRAFT_545979 [Piloderma croceum F 1598]|uniref:Uncharacterized protein n=1 Tax=Piloderma croceum (strain F 1598) TaxID=765440 RepID=A0A0C3FJZ6_PILCF|nr:hypothetical protein PILCRDRAFT_545979 [Piloderma croceum F 1598]
MGAKIKTGQKENKLINHNRKYEFGRLPGRYQIWRQHVSEMETWSPFRGQELYRTVYYYYFRQNLEVSKSRITISDVLHACPLTHNRQTLI